jgi:hypothetical protein
MDGTQGRRVASDGESPLNLVLQAEFFVAATIGSSGVGRLGQLDRLVGTVDVEFELSGVDIGLVADLPGQKGQVLLRRVNHGEVACRVGARLELDKGAGRERAG